LQSEIEQIALGLETLLTQRTHGKWKYVGFSGDNIPRNAGEFALASDDLSSQNNIITINLTDLNGMTIGLSDVKVGDYIEIVDDDKPANYALFTCTKVPEGTGISNIEVALKDKGNNFLVGDTCEIRFFSVNEENINLTELDARYWKNGGKTELGGQTTIVAPAGSFLNFQQEANHGLDKGFLTLRNATGENVFVARGNGQILSRADRVPTDKDEFVNKAYVDSLVEETISSAGGGFVPDYDWNQNTHYVYSGSTLTRKDTYPREDGDWCIADTTNNYMKSFASLDKVGRIGVQPPWGLQGFKAGYAGQIHFGLDTHNTSRPIAIFTVTTQERSGSYYQWYVRLLWCEPGTTVGDLDGKAMMPCQGAVYRVSDTRQQGDELIDEGTGEQIDEVTDGSSEAGE